MGCLTEKPETLLPARAYRILARAVFPATAPRCRPARRGRVGRWPAVFPDLPGRQGTVARGRGNVVRFLLPPGGAVLCNLGRPVSLAGAIAPATALRWHQDRSGAKAPGQRPPRPRRALRPRRVGRWPAVSPDLPVYGAPSRAGGETRCVSPPGVAVLCNPGNPISLAGAIAFATPQCRLPAGGRSDYFFSTRLTRMRHFPRAARDRDVLLPGQSCSNAASHQRYRRGQADQCRQQSPFAPVHHYRSWFGNRLGGRSISIT